MPLWSSNSLRRYLLSFQLPVFFKHAQIFSQSSRSTIVLFPVEVTRNLLFPVEVTRNLPSPWLYHLSSQVHMWFIWYQQWFDLQPATYKLQITDSPFATLVKGDHNLQPLSYKHHLLRSVELQLRSSTSYCLSYINSIWYIRTTTFDAFWQVTLSGKGTILVSDRTHCLLIYPHFSSGNTTMILGFFR